MKGDFTRDTFDPRKHFARVLMQQGRVQLDADWNEQVAILLHYLQTLAKHLIGPHGGPADELGFTITPNGKNDFNIGSGRYYVKGILCENEEQIAYTKQPGCAELKDGTYLVYLDVWERHITCIEDGTIREVALGGPDTATRAKIVWQVKTKLLTSGTACGNIDPSWDELVEGWQSKNRGRLKAQAQITDETDITDPCITSPEARYRGAENQLYRVEIHKGGTAAEGATFKWSRDNGSIVFPIRKLESSNDTTMITLEHLGRDDRSSLRPGDWVEIVDDDYVLQHRAEPLLKVKHVDQVKMEVTLEGISPSDVGQYPAKNPLLRRWDHKAGDPTEDKPQLTDNGDLLVEENDWLTLEDGVQIQFQKLQVTQEPTGEQEEKHQYRTGDYWLIPARTATGDVEWEKDDEGNPVAQPPHGVEHSYAPLAIISVSGNAPVQVIDDCRYQFAPSSNPVS